MDLETLTNQEFKPFIKNQSDYLTKISKSLQRQAAISEVYEKTTLPNMPELKHPAGYPAVIGLMILVTIIIYLWFKRKGWM